jgi:hypothetical protein
LQKLVERNHGVLLYPDWSNASDYAAAPKLFGTVPIHSAELETAIDTIILSKPLSQFKLTKDQKYLCQKMSTKLPLLPVVGKEECQLFNEMVDQHNGPILDFEDMAIAWCDCVDGVNIFPKLPVYLRFHYSNWLHNQHLQDSVTRLASCEDRLCELNASFSVGKSTDAAGTGNENVSATNATIFISMPPTMPQPPDSMLRPEGGGIAVGGKIIGGVRRTQGSGNGKLNNGERGKDGRIRSSRSCKYCLQHGKFDDALKCPGSQVASYCTGGMEGESLRCIHCNSVTKCRCPMIKSLKHS